MNVAVFALAWGSPRTTERCLASWRVINDRFGGERLIWYQEISDGDRQQAARHGFTALGSKENIGIGGAYQACLDRCDSEFAMFLECDWRITGRHAAQHLEHATSLIESGQVDVARLRSRLRPGWPVNTITCRGDERAHPYWLLDSCYWRRRPDRTFADAIDRIVFAGEHWFMAGAPHAAWTNNPHVARTALLRTVAERSRPEGAQFEPSINEWWTSSNMRIAQGRGIFTHSRVDGPSSPTTPKRELALAVKRAVPSRTYQLIRNR